MGAAPHAGQLARTRTPVAQAVTLPGGRDCVICLGRPPRRASSSRAKITVKGAPKGASLRDGASATPDTDLPRQGLGTYQEDGGKAGGLASDWPFEPTAGSWRRWRATAEVRWAAPIARKPAPMSSCQSLAGPLKPSTSSIKPKMVIPPPSQNPCRAVFVVCHHAAFVVIGALCPYGLDIAPLSTEP